MRNEATKDTTPFTFFKSNVAEASGLTVEAVGAFSQRIAAAYDMGEPVWMVAEEVRFRHDAIANAPRKYKTPRQLAVSVTRF